MKRLLSFALLFALLSFAGCDKGDGGENPFDLVAGTITINGTTYNTTIFVTSAGWWNKENGYGSFTISLLMGSESEGYWNDDHDFNFKSDSPIKVGDDLAQKELVYRDFNYNQYDYKSGKMKVVDIGDGTMTLKINNLVMEDEKGETYTFDGKVEVVFYQD